MDTTNNTNFKKVEEFHKTFGHPIRSTPDLDMFEQKIDLIKFRLSLIEEELNELKEAVKNNDIVEVADALTDILYVTYGAGHSFGVDLDKCFDEVQQSNMSKLGVDGKPIYNESGKVMKGPDYFAPDLKKIIT